jgi:serine phosphatase RsbU (regulator of sigma subunit)
VVEQTLVVSNYGGEGWSGRSLGINYPQRIVAIDGEAISTAEELRASLSAHTVGQSISVETIDPEGMLRSYPNVILGTFPRIDLLRLFWIPYLVGLAFLALGIVLYIVRGQSSSGRAFAFFCIMAAFATCSFFDLITTHHSTLIWFLAVTQLGTALITLGIVFPEEWTPRYKVRWLPYVPYLISMGLAIAGLVVLFDTTRPWSYVLAWRLCFLYIAFGIAFFLGMMVYRLRTTSNPLVRQQVWVILAGSLLAFFPIGIWLAAPIVGVYLPFITIIFLPFLLLFPISIGIAIMRYRLWDFDLIINRTLVFSAVTVLLGVLYITVIIVLQAFFVRVTGEDSPFAIALSTLLIAVIFNPVRRRTQAAIDRRFFRHKYEAMKSLAMFSAALRQEVDLTRLSNRLVNLVEEVLQPDLATLYTSLPGDTTNQMDLSYDGDLRQTLLQARDPLDLERLTNMSSPRARLLRSRGVKVIAPLISQGEVVGILALGKPLQSPDYSYTDRQLLGTIASQAAPALRVAQLVHQQEIEAQERQRIDHEMRLARFIQQTLLPSRMPDVPGWKVSGHYQPARAVGGDFFDFYSFSDGTLGVVIGDATGKGVPAALVMASVRSLMRGIARQGMGPGEVLRKVNELLIPTMPKSMFVTCLYAVVHRDNGLIQFANAGHPLPISLVGGDVRELRAVGMPLGLMPDMDYEEQQAQIERGECMVLYSDGLVEAHDMSQQMFGVPRLKQILCELHNRSGVIDSLLDEWRDFNGVEEEQEDDMTLVTLQRLP